MKTKDASNMNYSQQLFSFSTVNREELFVNIRTYLLLYQKHDIRDASLQQARAFIRKKHGLGASS